MVPGAVAGITYDPRALGTPKWNGVSFRNLKAHPSATHFFSSRPHLLVLSKSFHQPGVCFSFIQLLFARNISAQITQLQQGRTTQSPCCDPALCALARIPCGLSLVWPEAIWPLINIHSLLGCSWQLLPECLIVSSRLSSHCPDLHFLQAPKSSITPVPVQRSTGHFSCIPSHWMLSHRYFKFIIVVVLIITFYMCGNVL